VRRKRYKNVAAATILSKDKNPGVLRVRYARIHVQKRTIILKGVCVFYKMVD